MGRRSSKLNSSNGPQNFVGTMPVITKYIDIFMSFLSSMSNRAH